MRQKEEGRKKQTAISSTGSILERHFSVTLFDMVQKIVRLSEAVINQIAAGEVVEGPSSVVKELIENSLDAKASRISIAIQGGGLLSIEIEDDGSGMNREDAVLCLERHATSKIRTADDLQALSTMGFRGEALAAISSVSHFELKTSDGKIGTAIRSEGGKIESILPCARNRGTTISIRSLFYNTPARKKFQKSPSASVAQVVKTVETIALAHPEVAFTLHSGAQAHLKLEPQDQKGRIEAILGPFPHEIKTLRGMGFLSAPQDAKTHRRNQFLFINRRPVFSPLISRAVQAGYGTRLNENSHPPFVLFLEIPSDEVDVNVHPQKKEVRLSEESSLFREIEKAVSESFETPLFEKPIFFTPPPTFSLAEDPFSVLPAFPKFQTTELPFEIEDRPLAVFGKFLLMESFILVDLSGAHARVLFEEMKTGVQEKQALLCPLEIEIDHPETESALETIGVECRLIGPSRLAIDALPSSIDPSQFFSFFSTWNETKKLENTAVRYCRNLKKKYSLDEAFLLWRRLQKCKDSLYDPLGKKIWTQMERSDFEQILER